VKSAGLYTQYLHIYTGCMVSDITFWLPGIQQPAVYSMTF